MTLANRTALAAGTCGLVAVILATLVASVLFSRSLAQRVDDQLRQRATTAPVLAAVGDRIGISELSFVVDGARVATSEGIVRLGPLPSSGLPPLEEPGWRTVEADGESWRLLAVEVRDVPEAGDRALVEFVEPLGDVDALLRTLRRRVVVFGAGSAGLVAALGLIAGRRAARPLTHLAGQARDIGQHPAADWRVDVDTTTPEIEEIAGALNHSLGELAVASRRREEALDASRSFASAASHELRTPLQSAMIDLDIALGLGGGEAHLDGDDESSGHHVAQARAALNRMRVALAAVRQLSEVDLVDERAFTEADLADVVDEAVALAAVEAAEVEITQGGVERCRRSVWVDGLRLAIENLLRNALRHGRPADGSLARITVALAADGSITVDDNGPGFPDADRERLTQPFERGPTSGSGSGLGLAFANRVAVLHGGSLHLDDAPGGGARVTLALG